MGTDSSPDQAAACKRQWLTEREVGERLNISVKWLQTQRRLGGTLRFAKFGGAVRYLLDDIEKFERDSLRLSTSDPGSPKKGERQ